MTKTNTQRQADFRARQRAQGRRSVQFYLTPDERTALNEFLTQLRLVSPSDSAGQRSQ